MKSSIEDHIVCFDVGNSAVAQVNDAIGHSGDVRVVGDDRRCGAELAIDPFQRFEHHAPRLFVIDPVDFPRD